MPASRPNGQIAADAALAAYLLHALVQHKKPTNLGWLTRLWTEQRPDDPAEKIALDIRRAVTRLRDIHVVVRRKSGGIHIRNELMLRLAAEQHNPDSGVPVTIDRGEPSDTRRNRAEPSDARDNRRSAAGRPRNTRSGVQRVPLAQGKPAQPPDLPAQLLGVVMSVKITPEKRREIVEIYLSGELTTAEIAKRFNITQSYVMTILRREGVPKRKDARQDIPNYAANLGHAVAERRIERGLTIVQLSKSTGLSQATLSLIEKGLVKRPTATTASRLEKSLRWEPGSVRRTLKGGTPTEIPDSDASTPAEAKLVMQSDLPLDAKSALLSYFERRREDVESGLLAEANMLISQVRAFAPSTSTQDKESTDAALAAHLLHALVETGEPTSLHRLAELWVEERPGDPPSAVSYEIGRALARLDLEGVIVWRDGNAIRIPNKRKLRLAAEQHRSDT